MTVLAPILPLVLSALATLAPAELDPEAKEHFERGLAGYNEKAYATAVKEFRVAYALDPQPDILFAWAQAERLYGRCSRATKLYQRFLKSRPSQQQAEAARIGVDRCKDQPDTAVGDPEDHEPAEKVAETAPAPVVEDEPPPPPPPPPKRKVDGVGIGLLGGGVVLAGVGAGLLGAGQGKANNAADSAPTYDAYADEAAAVRRLRITGGVLAGIGGALIVGGIVKLVLHARQPRRDVAFWADPVGAGVHFRMRF